jgi:Putative zinc-finger
MTARKRATATAPPPGAERLASKPVRDHPKIEVLLAYGRNELTGGRMAAIQDHLARCRDCALLVLDFSGFESLAPPAPAYRVSAQELARQRLAFTRLLAAAHFEEPLPRAD